MAIVQCPTCARRYECGGDDLLAQHSSKMSLKVPCPACGQWARIPECEAVETPAMPPEAMEGMKRQSLLLAEDDPRQPDYSPRPKEAWWKFW